MTNSVERTGTGDRNLDALLKDVVRKRSRHNAVERDATQAVLEKALARLSPRRTEDQAITWYGQRWAERGRWLPATKRRIEQLASDLPPADHDGGVLITRRDVFDRREDDVDLFLAAMAWGFGPTGYGWWRTAQIINPAGHNGESRVAAAAAEAWAHGDRKIPGLGPAFASKVAYFTLYDREHGTGPLIADLTAWSLWALDGTWDSRHSPELYRAYVDWCERQAKDLRCRSEDVERALFDLGPAARRTWQRPRN